MHIFKHKRWITVFYLICYLHHRISLKEHYFLWSLFMIIIVYFYLFKKSEEKYRACSTAKFTKDQLLMPFWLYNFKLENDTQKSLETLKISSKVIDYSIHLVDILNWERKVNKNQKRVFCTLLVDSFLIVCIDIVFSKSCLFLTHNLFSSLITFKNSEKKGKI